MGGACSTHWRDEKFRILVDKCEENRPLGGAKCRWDDNIKMD
jgi:hypothetical protein